MPPLWRPMLAASVHDLVATLHPHLHAIALEAGDIALSFFNRGAPTTARIWSKDEGSPVTEADVAVDTFLKIHLSQTPARGGLAFRGDGRQPRIGSGSASSGSSIRSTGRAPFSSGDPDWSVSIALLADDRPVLGIVYAPAHGRFYEATLGGGAGATGRRSQSRRALAGDGRAGRRPEAPRRRLERRVGRPLKRLAEVPSLALRIAASPTVPSTSASSRADSRDWDLAAADLILHEAGGRLTDLDGAPLAYNQPDPIHGELAGRIGAVASGLIEAMTAIGPAATARR